MKWSLQNQNKIISKDVYYLETAKSKKKNIYQNYEY